MKVLDIHNSRVYRFWLSYPYGSLEQITKRKEEIATGEK
jgi:hypothetical protein